MNKINPFVLLGIIFVVFIALFVKASHGRLALPLEAKNLVAFEEEAKKVSALKKMWNKESLEERLRTLFGQVSDKAAVFEVKSGVLSRAEANEFMRKAITEAFEIRKFEFIAESESTYRVVMEIKK
ncbi:MAG: hypothetical protein LBQ18_05310 [Campylobacteraceae bacterium]|jgi:hypothetical protein|nr:hypothetical protein [Campylobacteraceae bacterium]